LGEILQNIETGIGEDAFGVVTDIMGATKAPWLVIAKKSSPNGWKNPI
jgi:rRNA processing protein Gar1